jgi:energy-coupling factor transporter ATP-binding protein EcfA2
LNNYSDFKILLDNPSAEPGLGFDAYASALSEVAVNSTAEFAVGIFGTWGSGKTTLMRKIERLMAEYDNVVTVWFTAWRYERDKNLIVPLLDVLREALDKRARSNAKWARDAAAGVARAARAFTAGLTLSVGVPGFSADVDAGKVIAAIGAESDGTKQLSFYQAGFLMLHDAIRQLSSNGRRRVVIFVDDLDRCLPGNALQVLESMKLFFDVEGCVFIVGLDQDIAERAIADKYRAAAGTEAQGITNGSEYVKKIFQVPFALPSIFPQQIREYLTNIEENANFSAAQHDDFQRNVRRHLRSLPSEDSFNPREIKRLINSYILQLKMLDVRLGERLDPDIVLALQIMAFRPDWRELYDHLAADPGLFQSSLRDVIHEFPQPDTVYLSGAKVTLTPGLLEYLREDARSVLDTDDLQSYVSAAEATRRSDSSIRDARVVVNRLRRVADELRSGTFPPRDAGPRFSSDVKRLADLTVRRARLSVDPVQAILSQLESAAKELQPADEDAQSEIISKWIAKVDPLFGKLDDLLRELDRQISVGADA